MKNCIKLGSPALNYSNENYLKIYIRNKLENYPNFDQLNFSLDFNGKSNPIFPKGKNRVTKNILIVEQLINSAHLHFIDF